MFIAVSVSFALCFSGRVRRTVYAQQTMFWSGQNHDLGRIWVGVDHGTSAPFHLREVAAQREASARNPVHAGDTTPLRARSRCHGLDKESPWLPNDCPRDRFPGGRTVALRALVRPILRRLNPFNPKEPSPMRIRSASLRENLVRGSAVSARCLGSPVKIAFYFLVVIYLCFYLPLSMLVSTRDQILT
jgi:hypothetical protein